ncbi:MAG: hypothetical protein JW855_04585 [Gammaproteobacteria bacterium]|nr:hypothetical protein [Gammaproteobacteria bacterium]
MVNKSSISKNLKDINSLFNKSIKQKETLFYSKLAILELCGWIEESMDEVVKKYAKRKLKNQSNIKFLDDNIISRVHGFDYNDHFRKMLMQVVGIIKLEVIEKRLNQTKLDKMQAALRTLRNPRGELAHTHIKGTTLRIDSPSVIQQKFLDVYEGLKDIESKLKRL